MVKKQLISIAGLFVLMILVVSANSPAQQGKRWEESRDLKASSMKNRVFDPETVQTVSGTVAAVEKIRPMEGMPYGIRLLVNTGTGNISVHLGPAWFLKEQEMVVHRHDRLQVSGSRVVFEGREAMIAASIRKGGRTLKLRDGDGIPLWSGWRRGVARDKQNN